jgi:hypothetical protein
VVGGGGRRAAQIITMLQKEDLSGLF